MIKGAFENFGKRPVPMLSRQILFWTFTTIASHVVWFWNGENLLSALLSSDSAGGYVVFGGFFVFIGFVALFVKPQNEKHTRDLVWGMHGALMILNVILCVSLAIIATGERSPWAGAFALAYAVQACWLMTVLKHTQKVSYAETRLDIFWILGLTISAIIATIVLDAVADWSPIIQLSTILTIGTIALEFRKKPTSVDISHP